MVLTSVLLSLFRLIKEFRQSVLSEARTQAINRGALNNDDAT
jgi:hypothetical protein